MTDDLYTEVLPRLWIGGTAEHDIVAYPKTLPSLTSIPRFDAVVTLYAYAQPMGWYVQEQRYGFADADLDTFSAARVEELAHWLYSRWIEGDTVLARCQAGWNRSGLVTALVLIRAGYTPREAVDLLRAKRSPGVLSNPEFEAFISEHRAPRAQSG